MKTGFLIQICTLCAFTATLMRKLHPGSFPKLPKQNKLLTASPKRKV